jgi:hypothetical protein
VQGPLERYFTFPGATTISRHTTISFAVHVHDFDGLCLDETINVLSHFQLHSLPGLGGNLGCELKAAVNGNKACGLVIRKRGDFSSQLV